MRLLVGAYTADSGGRATGIVALDAAADGSLQHAGHLAAAHSPSYLAAHGDLVYASSEAAGRVDAFRLGPGGSLQSVGSAEAGGAAPCHVARYDDTVLAACYLDGSLGVLSADPLALDQTVAAGGSGPHPAQDGAHAHATLRLADGTIVSADLGADRIRLHALAGGRLSPVGEVEAPPGTGPRDLLQHPGGCVYVLGELGLTVLVYLPEAGTLRLLSSAALPGVETGDHAAGLSLSDDGRYLYAGLRGSNRIGVLGVSPDGRALAPLASVDAAVDWPRHHVLVGSRLFVAGEKSDSVATFVIDAEGIPRHFSTLNRVFSPVFLLPVEAPTTLGA